MNEAIIIFLLSVIALTVAGLACFIIYAIIDEWREVLRLLGSVAVLVVLLVLSLPTLGWALLVLPTVIAAMVGFSLFVGCVFLASYGVANEWDINQPTLELIG